MIDENNATLGNLFTTDGKDVWRVIVFCPSPACILQNLDTKEKRNFSFWGLTAEKFHEIEMPINPGP